MLIFGQAKSAGLASGKATDQGQTGLLTAGEGMGDKITGGASRENASARFELNLSRLRRFLSATMLRALFAKHMNAPIRVAITGAAGQIGYSLLFRIASGAMFGPAQPVMATIYIVSH